MMMSVHAGRSLLAQTQQPQASHDNGCDYDDYDGYDDYDDGCDNGGGKDDGVFVGLSHRSTSQDRLTHPYTSHPHKRTIIPSPRDHFYKPAVAVAEAWIFVHNATKPSTSSAHLTSLNASDRRSDAVNMRMQSSGRPFLFVSSFAW